MSEIPRITPHISPSSGHQPVPHFIRTLGRLNGELHEALSDFKSSKVVFIHVNAAAYNLYCYINDHQNWITSGQATPSKEKLNHLSQLLAPHQSEKEALGNYSLAMIMIHNDITTTYFSQERGQTRDSAI